MFLENMFHVSNSTISGIVAETVGVISDTFSPIHMALPSHEDLLVSSEQFYLDTGFPNCVLLLDGKHFPVKRPGGTGNTYYSRKGFFSVNLQGMFAILKLILF